jgi:hypothetical protein
MIEVFKTSVDKLNDAHLITSIIKCKYGEYQVNFDLDDCDNIMRIASHTEIDAEEIIRTLASAGFYAEVLADEIDPVFIPY